MALFDKIHLKRFAVGLWISAIPYTLPAVQDSNSLKTLYDAADGFEFQYPASYLEDRATSGFRIEQNDQRRTSFLKIAEELTMDSCQIQGIANTGSCRVIRNRQHKNPQGLQIAEVDMAKTCSGECDDFIPTHFSAYVVNISHDGIKEFLVFEDVIEPADKQTLSDMAQTVKLISAKTL